MIDLVLLILLVLFLFGGGTWRYRSGHWRANGYGEAYWGGGIGLVLLIVLILLLFRSGPWPH